jgi:hypothetical protein
VESTDVFAAALHGGGNFAWDGSLVRVWQVSDRGNFALVTYTCDLGKESAELPDCERVVRSIAFGRGAGAPT